MNITKFAHACLLVEKSDARILLDPGSWSVIPELHNIDAVLITHEHQDHCDIEKLKAILERNPDASVITHAAVAKVLEGEGITSRVIEHGEMIDINEVSVQSCGTEHAAIYKTSPCRNTGFLIDNELFVPGDALHDVPEAKVRLLALPTGGPWMKMSEAIDYAKQIKPEVVFPIHDAMYVEEYRAGLAPRVIGGALEPEGIRLVSLIDGEPQEL